MLRWASSHVRQTQSQMRLRRKTDGFGVVVCQAISPNVIARFTASEASSLVLDMLSCGCVQNVEKAVGKPHLNAGPHNLCHAIEVVAVADGETHWQAREVVERGSRSWWWVAISGWLDRGGLIEKSNSCVKCDGLRCAARQHALGGSGETNNPGLTCFTD